MAKGRLSEQTTDNTCTAQAQRRLARLVADEARLALLTAREGAGVGLFSHARGKPAMTDPGDFRCS
jgi:hypothetical protein